MYFATRSVITEIVITQDWFSLKFAAEAWYITIYCTLNCAITVQFYLRSVAVIGYLYWIVDTAVDTGYCSGYLNWIDIFFFFFNFLKEKHIERKILQVFSCEISHLFTLREIRFKSGSHRWMLLLSVRKFWYSANFCVVSATLSV